MKRNLINCLVEKSNIEVSMSFEQYRSYRDGELNLAEIKLINDLDIDLGKLDINSYRILVIVIAGVISLISANPTIAYASGLDSINNMGMKFLDIIRTGMYWVCIIKGSLDVGKELTRGGDNMGNIGKIVVKYVLAFATLFLLPWCFDTVRDTFAQ